MTTIEWTRGDDGRPGKTWNPVRGCARVSPGCEHCYAERQAHRFSGVDQPYEGLTELRKHGPRWVGSARFVPEMLSAPLAWRKPTRVFVNSMSDLFHDDVTNEEIAAVFGVMAMASHHTFQVLTKRPERMCAWFSWLSQQRGGSFAASAMAALDVERERTAASDSGPLHRKFCVGPAGPWPLPNVFLGVSCEDQQRAVDRIPLLLATPAVVRFVSAEPLLGRLNLRPALRQRQTMPHENAPATWAAFAWPAWVPERVRAEIQSFWGPSCGRTPRDYLRDALMQGAPDLFATATLPVFGDRTVTGRFVHAWNNIGRIVTDNGESHCVHFVGRSYFSAVENAGRGLDWVIVGGESGPGARTCHLEWILDIVEQCRDAHVPCFVKQLGARPHIAVNRPDPSYPLQMRARKGGDMNEWPADLRVREFPAKEALP